MMEKKDIYEHLAKIYLDAPLRRPQVVAPSSRKIPKNIVISMGILLIIALAAVIFSVAVMVREKKSVVRDSQISHLLLTDAVKVKYRFDPSKKEVYSFNLNGLNLAQYKTLEFSLKKSDRADKLALRVEFTNIFNEKSESYLKDIPARWQRYSINLLDFMAITDWSQMQSLSFIAEEWNVTGNQGSFYIDNVALHK